jgi:hypothetical protein
MYMPGTSGRPSARPIPTSPGSPPTETTSVWSLPTPMSPANLPQILPPYIPREQAQATLRWSVLATRSLQVPRGWRGARRGDGCLSQLDIVTQRRTGDDAELPATTEEIVLVAHCMLRPRLKTCLLLHPASGIPGSSYAPLVSGASEATPTSAFVLGRPCKHV